MSTKILDRYGDLATILPAYRPIKGKGSPTRMLCICLICGNACTPVASNVRSGKTTTCGGHGRNMAGRPRLLYPSKEPISYRSMHQNLNRYHGLARNYSCADCPEMASEWSYVGNSPYERIDDAKRYMARYALAWSPYMRDYTPRCKSCHKIYDDKLAGRHRG